MNAPATRFDLKPHLARLKGNVVTLEARYFLLDRRRRIGRTRRELEAIRDTVQDDVAYLIAELEFAWQILDRVAKANAIVDEPNGRRIQVVSQMPPEAAIAKLTIAKGRKAK